MWHQSSICKDVCSRCPPLTPTQRHMPPPQIQLQVLPLPHENVPRHARPLIPHSLEVQQALAALAHGDECQRPPRLLQPVPRQRAHARVQPAHVLRGVNLPTQSGTGTQGCGGVGYMGSKRCSLPVLCVRQACCTRTRWRSQCRSQRSQKCSIQAGPGTFDTTSASGSCCAREHSAQRAKQARLPWAPPAHRAAAGQRERPSGPLRYSGSQCRSPAPPAPTAQSLCLEHRAALECSAGNECLVGHSRGPRFNRGVGGPVREPQEQHWHQEHAHQSCTLPSLSKQAWQLGSPLSRPPTRRSLSSAPAMVSRAAAFRLWATASSRSRHTTSTSVSAAAFAILRSESPAGRAAARLSWA